MNYTLTLLVLMFAASSLQAMDKKLTINLCDNQSYQLSMPAARQSLTLKGLIEDAGSDAALDLPQIHRNEFAQITDLMENLAHTTARDNEKHKLLESHLKQYANQDLACLIANANYLDIPLVHTTALDVIADRLQSAEYMKKFLASGQLDFTSNPETTKQILNTLKGRNISLFSSRSVFTEIAKKVQKLNRGNGNETPYRICGGDSGYFTSARFNESNNTVITASYDKAIHIWDAQTGNCIKVFNCANRPTDAQFFDNDTKIVSSSYDQILEVRDVASSECLKSIKIDRPISSFLLHPTGKVIISPPKEALYLPDDSLVIDINSEKIFSLKFPDPKKMILSRDGRDLLIITVGNVVLWDLEENSIKWEIPEKDIYTVPEFTVQGLHSPAPQADRWWINYFGFSKAGDAIALDLYLPGVFMGGEVRVVIDARTGSILETFETERAFLKSSFANDFDCKTSDSISLRFGSNGFGIPTNKFKIEYNYDTAILAKLESKLSIEQLLLLKKQYLEPTIPLLKQFPRISKHIEGLSAPVQKLFAPATYAQSIKNKFQWLKSYLPDVALTVGAAAGLYAAYKLYHDC